MYLDRIRNLASHRLSKAAGFLFAVVLAAPSFAFAKDDIGLELNKLEAANAAC